MSRGECDRQCRADMSESYLSSCDVQVSRRCPTIACLLSILNRAGCWLFYEKQVPDLVQDLAYLDPLVQRTKVREAIKWWRRRESNLAC